MTNIGNIENIGIEITEEDKRLAKIEKIKKSLLEHKEEKAQLKSRIEELDKSDGSLEYLLEGLFTKEEREEYRNNLPGGNAVYYTKD